MSDLSSVLPAIERAGLVPRGAFLLSDDERQGALADARTIVLVGMAGRSGWDVFSASPEARDGADHALDRFSRRVIGALAEGLGAAALYPFGDPPHFPFQRWARRCEPVHPSPLGLLIHPVYGLWHSYRGALGFPEALDSRHGRRRRALATPVAGGPALALARSARFSSAATTSPPARPI